MELNLDFLRPQERLSLQLRQLYEGAGFRHYHMSRFEEYGSTSKTAAFSPMSRSSPSRIWTGASWPSSRT